MTLESRDYPIMLTRAEQFFKVPVGAALSLTLGHPARLRAVGGDPAELQDVRLTITPATPSLDDGLSIGLLTDDSYVLVSVEWGTLVSAEDVAASKHRLEEAVRRQQEAEGKWTVKKVIS